MRLSSRYLPIFLTGLVVLLTSVIRAEDDPVAALFSTLDADADGRLTADEYTRRPGKKAVHLRDLKLLDFNRDQHLSPREFAAMPGLVEPHQRGPIPDPFDFLRDQAVAALDESYDAWDQRPTLSIPAGTFANTFARSLASSIPNSAEVSILKNCDQDGDGRVSRDEARAIIERQLGIHTSEGELIRQPNGRILDPGRFQWLDADKDGFIAAAEYAARYPDAMLDFAGADSDGDGRMSWTEYRDPRVVQSHLDLVEKFRKADADLDAKLSADELATTVISQQRELVPNFLSAFDDDGDGEWTLAEYQASPFGGPITPWHILRKDTNRDLTLTFDEFLLNKQDFFLLQRLYFFRFDRNGDDRLTRDEFAFEENPPNGLYRLAADGSRFELIWRDKTLPNPGSPEVSPDEKWIAFDLYPERKIMLVSLNGGEAKEICDGLTPTWSLDGKQFACSHRGVQIAAADGSDPEQFAPGWGAQWSPDGKSIAYEQNNGLWVYDVAQQAEREVLKAGEHRYGTLYYGMTWSPDSRRVALKAVQGEQSDIISVDTQGDSADLQVHFSTRLSISHDLSWSPDGNRLLFALRSEEHGRNLLHQLNLDAAGPPTIHPGIDTNLTYLNQSFSRDGTWLVLTAK